MQTLFDTPVKTDHESRILDYLLKGGTLTVQTCEAFFGTTELRTYIARIRKRHYNVVDKWKTENGDRFKEYFIKA